MGLPCLPLTPPRLSLAWSGNANELGGGFPAQCGTGMAEHRLNADLTGERSMEEGRFTVLLTWTDQFCICTQPFDFTAGKQ